MTKLVLIDNLKLVKRFTMKKITFLFFVIFCCFYLTSYSQYRFDYYGYPNYYDYRQDYPINSYTTLKPYFYENLIFSNRNFGIMSGCDSWVLTFSSAKYVNGLNFLVTEVRYLTIDQRGPTLQSSYYINNIFVGSGIYYQYLLVDQFYMGRIRNALRFNTW